MNTLQRILLRIVRLKNESIKIGCVFLVFAFLFLLASVVSASVAASTLSLPAQYQPYIKLQPKEGMENSWNMTDAIADRALDVENISGYNGLVTVYAMLPDTDLVSGRFSQSGDQRMNLTRLLGNNNSNQNEHFLSGDFSLVAGTHISAGKNNTVLISTDLATANNIVIGDSIKIETSADSVYGNPDTSAKSFSMTVTGVFEVTPDPGEDVSQKPECDIKSNFIFIDDFSAKQILSSLYEKPYEKYNSGILFFTTSPTGLDQTSELLLQQLNISNDNVTLMVSDGGYGKAIAPLLGMDRMLYLIMTIIVLAGGAVIAVVYFLGVRRRFREFAIFMSIGISKSQIIIQVFIEVLFFIIPAVLISTGVVAAIINGMDIQSVNLQLTPLNVAALAGYMIALSAIVIIVTAIILVRNKPMDLFSYKI